ncbi:MAG: YceI family protein [Chitinophagaceae bacterium]|nr:YceI family protein [Chitinophagaceae bacterium]MCW5905760.1 YceI family protein [Chitinophagaceae bacterium]
MKKAGYIFLLCTTLIATVQAQKVFQTKAGKIKFFSTAPLENIAAVNNQVDSKIATNGQMVFMVAIRGFRFENATMQEHFNENYMESDKYPKASYMGNIINLSDINFLKDGIYNATTIGDLEIHGVKRKVTTAGIIEIKSGKLYIKSIFKIKLADYNIKGAWIGEKIAKEIEITIDCKYD